ncbi:DE-cadherin [Temnothorax longispinosus]|uniref:DE-cadherin n=1 Tax=Temnothorax longispinosus TaxID=300112 RepID=A0A4S2JPH6_9HYME|nr:DE-cadherin [Temnothorax longispinosus]
MNPIVLYKNYIMLQHVANLKWNMQKQLRINIFYITTLYIAIFYFSSFTHTHGENFNDFDSSIVRLKAVSNIENSSNSDNSYLLFELVTGRTEQTNKENTFRLESNKDVTDIKLSQHLDYESNRQYSLIVRVQNKYQLAAETVVDIEVLDVSYKLENFKDPFAIDPQTGNITTLVTFDREVKDIYNVKIIATDNSPSALFRTGEHNKRQQVFQIEIADKNDNPPRFTRQ